jgi:hypothetical protein
MNSDSRITEVLSSDNDSSPLCFFTSLILFAFGTVGGITNYLAPGTTQLNSLLLVGVFYFVLGLLERRISFRSRVKGKVSTEMQAAPPQSGKAA